MAEQRVFVWVATLGKIRRGTIRLDADVESRTTAVQQQLAEAELTCSDGERPYRLVLGLASIVTRGVYHTMTRLTRAEREQLGFWESLANCSLSGHCYLFDVKHVSAVDASARLQHLTEKKFRGLVNTLEGGQGPRLIAGLKQPLPELPPALVPSIVVRLPAPYAQLLVAGHCQWNSFLLPQVPAYRPGFAGTRGLTFCWRTLGLVRPVLPDPDHGHHFNECELSLTADVALEIADALRDVANNRSEDNAVYDPGTLQKHVATMQLVHDQLQANHIVKMPENCNIATC